jgi:hypothetical protein
VNYSRRPALAIESSKFGHRKSRFSTCAFFQQHHFCQVLLTAKTIFSWLFWVDAGLRLAREVHVSERGRLRPHERRRLELAPAGLAPSPPHPRPSARLGNPHQYARPAMRPPARGSRATASASSPRSGQRRHRRLAQIIFGFWFRTRACESGCRLLPKQRQTRPNNQKRLRQILDHLSAMSRALPIEASWMGREAQFAYVRLTSDSCRRRASPGRTGIPISGRPHEPIGF